MLYVCIIFFYSCIRICKIPEWVNLVLDKTRRCYNAILKFKIFLGGLESPGFPLSGKSVKVREFKSCQGKSGILGICQGKAGKISLNV